MEKLTEILYAISCLTSTEFRQFLKKLSEEYGLAIVHASNQEPKKKYIHVHPLTGDTLTDGKIAFVKTLHSIGGGYITLHDAKNIMQFGGDLTFFESESQCDEAVAVLRAAGGHAEIMTSNLWSVILDDIGTDRIAVIKAVRDITNRDLMESREIVDSVIAGNTTRIATGVIEADALRYAARIEMAGGTAIIKPMMKPS